MSEGQLLFLKLGGSLITDKTGIEAARHEVIVGLAAEVADFLLHSPRTRLVVGHGSGSFGHVVAARHDTRRGVGSHEAWQGFCEVSAAALRLNSAVREALLAAGVPVQSFQPSASAVSEDGRLVEMAWAPIRMALGARLTPLVHGDVCFDRILGGTIISTEQVLSYLAKNLTPRWLLLAGDTPGVLDADGQTISHISRANFSDVQNALRGSTSTDVTGGMASKVDDMMALVRHRPDLGIRIFSGVKPGQLTEVLKDPQRDIGTLITA
jgi:isopentenyl phosphate kinase